MPMSDQNPPAGPNTAAQVDAQQGAIAADDARKQELQIGGYVKSGAILPNVTVNAYKPKPMGPLRRSK